MSIEECEKLYKEGFRIEYDANTQIVGAIKEDE